MFQVRKNVVRAIDIAAPVAGVTMCACKHSRILTELMCVQQDQIRGEVVPEVRSPGACAFAAVTFAHQVQGHLHVVCAGSRNMGVQGTV